MNEQELFKNKAESYLVCLADHCPRHEECLRWLAIPVGVYFLFRLIGIDETINRINTILIGMPVASFGTMFCLKYQRDETLMVQGTLLTTIFSVITIPLLTLLF